MGRKPKPTALKALAGNPGKRPLNDREPKPTAYGGGPPEWLGDEAKAVWKQMAPALQKAGLLTVLDVAAFTCLCQCAAEIEIASKILKQDGHVITSGDKGYKQQHPAVGMLRSAWRMLLSFAGEFGLTPASRQKATIADLPMSEGEAKWDAFFALNTPAKPSLAQFAATKGRA